MLSGLAIAITAYVDWRAFRIATRQAGQTRQILAATERVLSEVKDAETGQRGYLLTGDIRYLEPYNSARICQKTIDRNGGRIWVESEPGKSSTFFFTVRALDKSA